MQNINVDKSALLRQLEDHHSQRFLCSLPAARAVDTTTLVEIMIQRRLLSLDLFTWMLDRLICALELEEAREIATGILREEYAAQNHRYLFLMEITRLGVLREEIIRRRHSKITGEVARRIKRKVHALEIGPELDRLLFLRYFAEVLPGHEFSWIMQCAQETGVLKRENSCFLWPHVEFDMLGRDTKSHAQRYLPLIEQTLASAGDWQRVGKLIAQSAEIRIAFYRQFR